MGGSLLSSHMESFERAVAIHVLFPAARVTKIRPKDRPSAALEVKLDEQHLVP